jgi:hypothetical protein
VEGKKNQDPRKRKSKAKVQMPSNIEATQDVEVIEQQMDDTNFPNFFPLLFVYRKLAPSMYLCLYNVLIMCSKLSVN